ncbi:MAG: hypothetical protein JWN86_786 [Planctomycetota bacterium]|nr:hypothetical protein [Planctomycetota bacterium]
MTTADRYDKTTGAVDQPPLSWSRSDIEQKLYFRGGRYTRVNLVFALLTGIILTLGFYGALYPFEATIVGQSFMHRGIIPYTIIFFFSWSLMILVVKGSKLRFQKRALGYQVVPTDPDFVLTPATVDEVTRRIYETADDPREFLLFNRILVSLSNLRNLGRISDVDDMLRAQAENDEAGIETSYSVLQGFVWAIPVLGFIGTVLGLSEAIGSFGAILSTSSDLAQIKPALQKVTVGLAVAFETTLHGLVGAMIIQLWMTAMKVGEQTFLDNCGEYCLRHVVGKLRLTPFDSAGG